MTSAGVIINADDFGLTPGVNRGVLSCFREGVLTSTTMLVNLRFFEDAVAIARENPDLPVGIHLSLLWGRPISAASAVPTLVESDGCFSRGLGRLARRYFLGRLSMDEVQREFRAQIRKFLDAGLQPTHFDTHKHVHSLPGIRRALIAVAEEFGIRKLRIPLENGVGGGRPSLVTAIERNVVRFLCRDSRAELERAGFKTTDNFVGIDHMEQLDARALSEILRNLPDGVTELMCHPGYADEHLSEFARTPPDREQELAGLKDPAVKQLVASRGIRLMNYGEL